MYLLVGGLEGKYLARGQNVRNEPNFIINRLGFEFFDGVNPRRSVRFTSRAVRVFPSYHLTRTALTRSFFHMAFQNNCARDRTGYIIN